MWKSRKKK